MKAMEVIDKFRQIVIKLDKTEILIDKFKSIERDNENDKEYQELITLQSKLLMQLSEFYKHFKNLFNNYEKFLDLSNKKEGEG